MGEYEPDDSRKVTQSDHRAPGEPPRTGPREDEARRRSKDKRPQRLAEPQQRAQQAQASAGQKQSQSQSAPPGRMGAHRTGPGNPDRQDMQAEPGGPLAGNQPQAIDNPVGTARPKYDQYELSQPQTMHRQDPEHERKVRQQAEMQDDGDRGFGYGADGEEEMAEAPDASEAPDEKPRAAPDAAHRGYGGRGKAAEG